MNPDTYLLAAAAEEEHWWFAGRRDVLRAVLDCRLASENARSVLEVGCGNGGNLPLLARYGAVSAIELDDGARARATARGLARVEKGWLPDGLPFGEETFHLIAALDVIEHVENDVAALGALRVRLRKGGMLFLTVPAFAWLWSRHDEWSHHKRRYTAGTLGEALARAGLRTSYTSYFNTLLFPAGVAHIKLSGLLGRVPQGAMNLPPRPLNDILRLVFSAERYIVPRVRLPFGISLLACAHAI